MELSVHEAAKQLGVSEATIRRRIRRGNLRAIKHTLPSGYEWRVLLDDHGVSPTVESAVTIDHPVHPHESTPQRTDDHPAVTVPDQGVVTTADSTITDDHPAITPPDIMRFVERLYSENQQLAGRIGWLESQLQHAQEQIRMLTDSQHAPAAEPTPQPDPAPQMAEPKRAPWWKRLFAEI